MSTINNDINTYLTFRIGIHFFGVSVSKVLEISEFRLPRIVPECPQFMRGVIEFRDQVIPLIDAAQKFGMPAIEANENTCMVVLDLFNDELSKKFKVSIVVDAVSDVFEAESNELKVINDEYRPGYITSSYRSESGLVLIINADKIFSSKDIISIEEIVNTL
jgi:purine-binding chemotaxis protein CheW